MARRTRTIEERLRRNLMDRARRIERAYPRSRTVGMLRDAAHSGDYDYMSIISTYKTSDLRGLRVARRKAIASLQGRGYDVDEQTLDDFTEAMEAGRRELGKKAFDSDAAAMRFGKGGKRDIREIGDQADTSSKGLKKLLERFVKR